MNHSLFTPAPLLTLLFVCVVGAAWMLVPHPALVIVLCALPIAILVVIRHLFWFVILFVVFSFFRIHEVIPQLMPFKLPLLLSLGALASLCWHAFISRTLPLYWHHSMKWLVIFWALVAVGLVFASNRGIAITSFKSVYWKIIIMTLAIIWIVNNKEQLSQTCWLIVWAGLLVAGVAIYNAQAGIGLVEGSRVTIGRNIGSMLGDPNDLALVLLFPLAFSVSFLFNTRLGIAPRAFGLLVAASLSLAIIETQSRGGLLGMLTVYGVFMQQSIKSKTLLAFIAVVGIAFLYVAAGISDRASGGAAEEGIDASAMGRIYAWEAAARMALVNPLTGVGLNNFYFNYYFYSSHWDGLNHAVHSTWFGVLAETGILGLIVFVTLIVSLARTAKQSLNLLKQQQSPSPYLVSAAKAVFAGLMGTIVSGTFLTQGFVWPIYILAALIISISTIVQKDSQNEKIN
ncbi:O-antigen ligase family protein [Vibrio agarivorans]|uniref:O-antigen ligase family protein n=1 Tax=Vibrio agarivorans TaxID=153622 RepID=A0ABT7XYN3_9VIBR|nr:O-antigen ligase family protein [Vibrio agarivorans]MDN2480879.1 O-antigen ligase family protein [Vibrio agarivorans]